MAERDDLVLIATTLAARAVDVLTAAGEVAALPHIRQAVAILRDVPATPSPRPDNKAAVSLLRMALTLLDRDGEIDAACDVDSALAKLGATFGPPLSEPEAMALLNWRLERARIRQATQASGNARRA